MNLKGESTFTNDKLMTNSMRGRPINAWATGKLLNFNEINILTLFTMNFD